MATKSFHISALLSVLPVDVFCAQGGLQDVYDLLEHLTGDTVMQHQVPLAADAMEPELIRQFPWLKDIPEPQPQLTSEAECVTWAASIADVHGEWHEVDSAPQAWGRHDPIADFRNQYPDTPMIVIETGGA